MMKQSSGFQNVGHAVLGRKGRNPELPRNKSGGNWSPPKEDEGKAGRGVSKVLFFFLYDDDDDDDESYLFEKRALDGTVGFCPVGLPISKGHWEIKFFRQTHQVIELFW